MENSKIMIENNLTAIVYTRKAKALEGIMEGLKAFDGKIVDVRLQKKLCEAMNIGYQRELGSHLENEWDIESVYYSKETNVGWKETTDKYTLKIRVRDEYEKYTNYSGHTSSLSSNNGTDSEEIVLVVEEKRFNYEATKERIQKLVERANQKAQDYSFDSRTVEEFADLYMQLDKQFARLKEETSYELQETIKELFGGQLTNLRMRF